MYFMLYHESILMYIKPSKFSTWILEKDSRAALLKSFFILTVDRIYQPPNKQKWNYNQVIYLFSSLLIQR